MESITITLDQAKALSYGDMIHHNTDKNADGTPQRWRVNGKPKVWKTRPDEVQVPIKRGMYEYDYLTHYDLTKFSLGEGY